MKTINANPNRTEHIHVRTNTQACIIVACLCEDHEHLVYDRDLSARAGYAVQSVRLDEDDPATETATISNLGHRFEITSVRTGASTMVWWDED